MQDQTNNPQKQKQSLQFHSKMSLLDEQYPLFKQSVKPYDYYFQYSFLGDLSLLNFWRQLEQSSNLVIRSQFISIQEQERSFLSRWLGLGEGNRFEVDCFFKYYNYTVGEWISYQRDVQAMIAEENLLFIAKQLLEFVNKYREMYGLNCGQIKADRLFITPQKTLRIYPHCINFKGQICTKTQFWSSSTGRQPLSKQISIQTTLTNSRVEESSYCGSFMIEEDVRDVFLLILQMATLKSYSYFYSYKHQAILWDAVGAVLSSAAVMRLSGQTQAVLKECFEGRMFEGEWLLSRIEKIVKNKVNMCKTINMQKNQQLSLKIKQQCDQIKMRQLNKLNFPANTPSKQSVYQSKTY